MIVETFTKPDIEVLKDSHNGMASLDVKEQEMKILSAKFKHELFQEIEKPPTVLSIGSHIWGTAGNFSIIIGKAKSKKTFLATIALAAISGQSNVCGISSTLLKGQEKVLFFDTEQCSYHVHQVVNRVNKMTSVSDTELANKLIVYQLREADSIDQRKDFIEYTINNTEGIGIVIIDGIRDLVRSINDEGEASNLVCSIMKWSSELNIHIVAVLHTNKNDANARGHLGTELMNKSETTLMVEKNQRDDSVSIVSPEYTRNISFDEFAFSVDFDGIPYLTGIPSAEQRTRRKPTPDEITKDEYMDCVENWKKETRLSAISKIQKYFDVGTGKAREYLDHMVDNDYVKKIKIDGINKHVYE